MNHVPTQNGYKKIYYLLAALIALSFVLMAWRGFPLGETDSLFFPPAAVAQKQGHGLYNFVHERAHIFDPQGEMRFLFYPPGHPLFMSSLMIEPTGRGAMTSLACICAAALMISAWLTQRYLCTKGKAFGKSELIWGSFALIGLATYLGAFRLGRPDFTATLISLLILWVQWDVKSGAREWLSAILLGLMAFTHPVATFYVSTFLAARYAWELDSWKWIKPLLIIYLGGVIVMLIAFFISPHGIKASFEGILLHSRGTLIEGTKHHIFKYWILHTYASFYGPLFVAAVIILLQQLKDNWKTARTRWLLILSILGFAMITEHFVASAWDRSYNLWVFAPFYFALLVSWAISSTLWKKITAFAILAGCAIGYLHTLAMFAVYEKEGYAYNQARIEFAKVFTETDELIGVSKSLWILSDNHQRMRSYGLNPAHLESTPGIIVLQQRYAYHQTPPSVKGYKLVRDNFNQNGTRLFGIKLSPTPPGYNFAVYKRESGVTP